MAKIGRPPKYQDKARTSESEDYHKRGRILVTREKQNWSHSGMVPPHRHRPPRRWTNHEEATMEHIHSFRRHCFRSDFQPAHVPYSLVINKYQTWCQDKGLEIMPDQVVIDELRLTCHWDQSGLFLALS
jgi:hypothetical protein